MKKQSTKRFLSALLVVVMLLSVAPLGGFVGLDLFGATVSATSYDVGDIVEFGSYPQSNNSTYEPIKWVVIDTDSKGLFLLSLYALDVVPYHTSLSSVTWETSYLRSWLNNSFYNRAFNENEKKQILTTTNENEDSSFGVSGGNDTQDKLFCLSLSEREDLVSSYVARCTPTSYTKSCGVTYANQERTGNVDTCDWWLRSPGKYSSDAYFVDIIGVPYYVTYYGERGYSGYNGVTRSQIGVRPAMRVSSISSVSNTVPDNYDFFRDSYSFENFSASIGKKYFQTLFGESKGTDLWKRHTNQGGVCFGMTYTTASLINGFPDCNKIRDLKRGNILTYPSYINIGDNSVSIRDYIYYAHIYQFSVESQNRQTWTDVNTIYNIVKEYVNDNQIGVTIGMTRRDGTAGHRVLAVGIAGNSILIDDPNNISGYERIVIGNNGSWSFTGLSDWNNTSCKIRYSVDYFSPYSLLSTGKTVTSYLSESETETYINGMDTLSKDQLLLTVDCDECDIDSENIVEIITEDNSYSNETTASSFWVNDDKSITISNIEGDNNSFSLTGNNTILNVETNDSSDVTLTVDEGVDVGADISSTKGSSYKLSATMFDDEMTEISISGIATGEEVSLKQEENNLVVSGLSELTVTYSDEDSEISQKEESNESGREVTIKVDEDEGEIDIEKEAPFDVSVSVNANCKRTATGGGKFYKGEFSQVSVTLKENDRFDGWFVNNECVSTDPTYSFTVTESVDIEARVNNNHADNDHNGRCDSCDRDNTQGCDCRCHKDGFAGFIYKIVRIFWKLFRTRQICDCGISHY